MIAQRTDLPLEGEAATPVYSDAYIDELGEEFVALRLHEHGVSFLDYLADPARYRHLASRYEPLLPAQRAVQARLDAEAAALEAEAEALQACPSAQCRGGAYVEPLHHHRYGQRSPAASFRRHRSGRS